MKKRHSLFIALLIAVVTITPSAVFAENGSNSGASQTSRHDDTPQTIAASSSEDNSSLASRTERAQELRDKAEQAREQAKQQMEAAKLDIKHQLTDKRLQICKDRMVTLNTVLKNSNQRAKSRLTAFQAIADQVEKFVGDKKLTVANYDSLVATMHSKEAAAVAAVEAAGTVNFECANQDSDGVGAFEGGQLKAEYAALRGYRDSIKNLISAVRTTLAQSQQTSNTNKEQQ